MKNYKYIFNSLKIFVSVLCIFCVYKNGVGANNGKQMVQGTLYYEQCNMVLKKIQKENIRNLGENLCIFIKDGGGITTILAKKENKYGLSIIQQDTLEFLKRNYYRGQEINIRLEGTYKTINQNLDFKKIKGYSTLEGAYKITFLSDKLLQKKIFLFLETMCTFSSFKVQNCKNKRHYILMKKVEKTLLKELIKKKGIISASYVKLQNEREKIKKISKKINNIEQYYKGNRSILLVIKMIQYRLNIYMLVLTNRLQDLDFTAFVKENRIHYKNKILVGDLYISQSPEYTFFYYGEDKINTLENNTSHFSDENVSRDKKLSTDPKYLREKIREKYSAEYVKGTDKRIIFIRKKYTNQEKYLLFDTINKKVFTFYGEVKSIEYGSKGLYMLLEDYTGENIFVLYNGVKIQKIIETNKKYNITRFELLIGKKVKIDYILDEGVQSSEVISIEEY